MKNLIISLLISLGVGGLSALITGGSMDTYMHLTKPPLAPPSILFPIVWTILFILMGISSYMIYESGDDNSSLKTYLLQLVINFIWPILFFVLDYRLLALIWIILLDIIVIIMIVKFYKNNKIAAYLQIPYLLWILFATYLNLGFYILNK
ncbi:MAG: tryptophan-rich sensory protein [Bacilli bacterium]|nr:tryptophan-rich sensory protein [Bacilli bacterium]